MGCDGKRGLLQSQGLSFRPSSQFYHNILSVGILGRMVWRWFIVLSMVFLTPFKKNLWNLETQEFELVIGFTEIDDHSVKSFLTIINKYSYNIPNTAYDINICQMTYKMNCMQRRFVRIYIASGKKHKRSVNFVRFTYSGKWNAFTHSKNKTPR
jgi:hypothetical protein